jgi:hypothetical protein
MEILGGFLTLLSYTELLQLVLLTARGGMITKSERKEWPRRAIVGVQESGQF